MNKFINRLLLPALLLAAGTLCAGGEASQNPPDDAAQEITRSMLQEAQQARAEAEIARERAVKAAERAREEMRKQEQAAHQAQAGRQRTQEETERAVQREEMERAREELSRAHRELREASREVARAHRDLARSGEEREITMEINLGDRAVIGVVLGSQTDKGVEIIGVSPDGPAERAGLEPGDVLQSIRGIELINNDEARQSVFSVMQDVEDGEELAVTVDRSGQLLEFTVTAEEREPRGWLSTVRIPEIPADPQGPGSHHVIVKTIEVPEIDEEALAAEISELAELAQRIETRKYTFVTPDGHDVEHFEFEDFSEMGEMAMSEANIWFSLPQAHGLELTSINEGLGSYFKTDRGVLVIKARDDNAYRLESGDVILSIGGIEVDSPSDLMRALRDVEPGSEMIIEIKRDRKNKSLKVTVPENRLGSR